MILQTYNKEGKRQMSNSILLLRLIGIQKQRNSGFIMIRRVILNNQRDLGKTA